MSTSFTGCLPYYVFCYYYVFSLCRNKYDDDDDDDDGDFRRLFSEPVAYSRNAYTMWKKFRLLCTGISLLPEWQCSEMGVNLPPRDVRFLLGAGSRWVQHLLKQ